MKLIKHIIPVDIENDEKLLINSLNGTIDKIGLPVYEIIQKWQNCDKIIAENEIETVLYNNLLSRGYLVNSNDEEMLRKNQLVEKLRELHKKRNETCDYLTFILTYNCNFRCPYCFEGERTLKTEVISPSQIDAALELAGEHLERVGLFGGEPLLPSSRASLEYLVSKTSDKIFNITTNGYYLEEFFDLLSPLKFSYITVTLDGDEDTHNSRRYLANGKPTFQKIMKGIEKYLENGMPIRIRMNLDSGNLDETRCLQNDLINKFSEHTHLLTFELGTLFGVSNDEKTGIATQMFNEDSAYSSKERLQRNSLLGTYNSILNTQTIGAKLKPTYSYCYAHSNLYIVDPYGDIYTCLQAVGMKDLAVGAYFPEVTFKENSLLTRNIETIPECRECIYSLLCGGGCPLPFGSYEDVWKPECFLIKNQIHNLLPKFYAANSQAKGQSEQIQA